MNKRDELQLEIEIYKPDIIILTEIFPKGIKSTDIMDQELKISGFNLILGKVTEKCRGVCIYIRDGLSFRECTNLNNSAFNESCWCILRLNSNEQILIGGIYPSPNCSAINSKKLLELINTAVNLKYDYTVLVGDFNYPNISWKDWTTPYRERSGSVVVCLTRDRRAAGSSLTGVTALWSLSKTHLS